MNRLSRLYRLFAVVVVVALFLVSLAVNVGRVRAATQVVTNLNDSGPGSLREAVAAVENFGTITFEPGLTGTIVLSDTITIGKPMSIIGNPGIILDGNRSVRVLNIDASTLLVKLQYLIIQRGFSTTGAGINIPSPNTTPVVFEHVIIRDNHATGDGGGVFYGMNGGTFFNVSIYNNSANRGGGMYMSRNGASPFYLESSLVAGNISYNGAGAGIYAIDNNLVVKNSQISGNMVTGNANGGGIAAVNTDVTITDSTISGNSGQFGGGVYSQTSAVTINGALFARNRSKGVGGGISLAGNRNATITNSTFEDNFAETSGGGINITNNTDGVPNVTIAFTTVTRNQAMNASGGIRINAGTTTLKANLIAENIAPSNADLAGTFTSQGYNLVQNRGTSTGYIASDLPNGATPVLDILRNNGGATSTVALLTGSAALNAVPQPACTETTIDQRGYARPTSGNCDIGAFEVGSTAPTPTPSATPTHTPTNTPSPTATNTPTATSTATVTNTPIPPRPDTIGVYKDGTFYLRNSNSAGMADITANFGSFDASDLPVAGDWNGDGVDSIGVYRSATGFFLLSDSNTTPVIDYTVLLGNPGDMPFAGKWLAAATNDGIGVFRPSNGILYAKNALTSGFSDYFAIFGNPGDAGVAGDWDGNGRDSIGIYRPSNQTWYMTNNSEPSGVTFSDIDFAWGIGGNTAMVGDWDGDGDSTPGYFASGSSVVVQHGANASTGSDTVFVYGMAGGKPVAGKWSAPSRPAAGVLIQPVMGGFTSANDGNAD